MTDSHDVYLEAQVMTAPPHKLHLMLIHGALKFTRLAMKQMDSDEMLDAVRNMGRAREIVSEVMVSFRTDDQPLAGRVRRVYLFLFRQLTEAQLEQSREKLEGALKVLQVECDTWQQVCEKQPATVTVDQAHHNASSPHIGAPSTAANEHPTAGGLSFEA